MSCEFWGKVLAKDRGQLIHRNICLHLADKIVVYLGSTPHPVTVTTRIITCLIGNPYKPSFVTVTGWGVDPGRPKVYLYLVGGFNPFEKYARQIGSFPQVSG